MGASVTWGVSQGPLDECSDITFLAQHAATRKSEELRAAFFKVMICTLLACKGKRRPGARSAPCTREMTSECVKLRRSCQGSAAPPRPDVGDGHGCVELERLRAGESGRSAGPARGTPAARRRRGRCRGLGCSPWLASGELPPEVGEESPTRPWQHLQVLGGSCSAAAAAGCCCCCSCQANTASSQGAHETGGWLEQLPHSADCPSRPPAWGLPRAHAGGSLGVTGCHWGSLGAAGAWS